MPPGSERKSTGLANRCELASGLLQHLLDTYQIHTPIDPEDLANPKALNLAFIIQPNPDICRKIQNMDEIARKNRSELWGNSPESVWCQMQEGRSSDKEHGACPLRLQYKSQPLSALPSNTMIKRGDLYKSVNAPTAEKLVTGKMNVRARNR